MAKADINKQSPDFSLADYKGNTVTLSDYQGKKNVLLVFNRGFFWPYCQKHMAQLRQSIEQFTENDTEIVVVGPENAAAFETYFTKHKLPFVGLPDPKHSVLKLYGQEVKLFKFGRMPAQLVVDKNGIVRFAHYGHDMTDIPKTAEVLGFIQAL